MNCFGGEGPALSGGPQIEPPDAEEDRGDDNERGEAGTVRISS